MPCNDMDEAMDAEVKTEIKKLADHQEQQESDACSPFCQCACCAGFSLNHFVSAVDLVIIYDGKAHSAYMSSTTLEIAFPVWQPPQLS